MKRILCLWFPAWPAQPPNRHVCATAPAAASHSPRAALARLAVEGERFSPLVSLEPGALPECLWLDVTGIGRLFGGEPQLLRAAGAHFAARGYTLHAALAPTPGAAWALAHAAALTGPERASLNLPEIAAAENLAQQLRSLPLALVRLPPATQELLGTLGLTRLEQLLALPRSGLATRFGPELLRRVDQLLGAVEEPLVLHRPPPAFAVERALEDAVEGSAGVLCLLEELVAQLVRQLAHAGQGALQLEVRLDCAGHAPVGWRVGLYRPAVNARHLLELLHLPLEQMRLPGAVGRVGLTVPLAGRLEEEQGELFAGSKRQAARQLSRLIDRLSSRLGGAHVLGARRRADPLPERAVELRSLVGHALALPTKKSPGNTNPVLLPRVRPLRLLPVPRPLRVVALAPEGCPVSFELGGRRYRVERHWGPERLETGWWRGASQRRDYFRVETTTGARYWLFRSLASRRWFWHGIFA